ncbi:MAG: exodeoxyribonuclease VII large subunit [Verrucomicrobiota bacterium]|nr:exodeoxyribonuclease VII large subunit [Verrucomicrobiota bacterium]
MLQPFLSQNINSSTPASTERKVYTVTEINMGSRLLLEKAFPSLWITGEVSNLLIHRSGHVYFVLKDARAQISCTFFGGASRARNMRLSNGIEIEACGRLSIYENRGQFQLNVNTLRTKGLGVLLQKFEELKNKLFLEGLFEQNRKKQIPQIPRCVGVITSPTGAAIRDFLQIIDRRFSNIHIRIYPSSVQGDRAAREVSEGIRYLNQNNSCDVIVVTRGGGSIEDLWSFNEEIVARAVADSAIPVISAVGHEIDTTICDLAADLRVPTPSAAAELVIGSKTEYLSNIENLRRQLLNLVQLIYNNYRSRYEVAAKSYVFREPANLIKIYAQQIDENCNRMKNSLLNTFNEKSNKFLRFQDTMMALSPKRVLKRGYSVLISEKTGKAIMDSEELQKEDILRAILANGQIKLKVEEIE